MRVLIAPDKFKGTLTAHAAAEAIARGWRRARPHDSLDLLPISDGGDGFGEVMSELTGAGARLVQTLDAAHRSCKATWWWSAKTKTAIIESARVIGLAMLPKGKFHPFQLDTFGLGAVLRAAQRLGPKEIIVGIGGSATNEAGFGLARALGWEFLDRAGNRIESWTNLKSLADIHQPKQTPSANILVAVDVRNPLLGIRGASRVYGPQKGLRPHDIAPAEQSLRRLATVLKQQHDLDFARTPGAGAAGGLGFGLLTFVGAKIQAGFDLMARHSALERRMRQADLVVTGEGAIDRTTAMGKGCGEIARRCSARQIPCLGLSGTVIQSASIQKLFQQVSGLTDLTEAEAALRRPAFWLTRLAEVTAANLVCKPGPRR